MAGQGLEHARRRDAVEPALPRGRWDCSSAATGERPDGSSYPGRSVGDPLPIFARAFTVGRARTAKSHQGAGCTSRGSASTTPSSTASAVTDEVLAPGNSNYQLSTEYRTYDVTRLIRPGANTVGVELGHGTALVTRSVTNPATGRTAPYSWWQSQFKGSGTLAAPAAAGDTVVKVGSVAGYHVGGTINIDTGDGGDRLESRKITAIGTAGADGTGITFEPALSAAHAAGAAVTGSGNPIASTDPSAGAAVTPRMIARLEITKADGSVETIVSDRSWKAALGPTVYDMWFSGSDYDSRREQPGWTRPGADLSETATRRDGSPVGWVRAGIAPPPNLTTELVWRAGEPVEGRRPDPAGQRHAAQARRVGVRLRPELRRLAGARASTAACRRARRSRCSRRSRWPPTAPSTRARSWAAAAVAEPTCSPRTPRTATGDGETWHPQFNYFGMQWVQVTGLPEGYTPTVKTITGLQVQRGHARGRRRPDVQRPDQPDPPHGALLDHEQHDVDVHGLPGTREARLPRGLPAALRHAASPLRATTPICARWSATSRRASPRPATTSATSR